MCSLLQRISENADAAQVLCHDNCVQARPRHRRLAAAAAAAVQPLHDTVRPQARPRADCVRAAQVLSMLMRTHTHSLALIKGCCHIVGNLCMDEECSRLVRKPHNLMREVTSGRAARASRGGRRARSRAQPARLPHSAGGAARSLRRRLDEHVAALEGHFAPPRRLLDIDEGRADN